MDDPRNNYRARLEALRRHPLAQHSMNASHLGRLGIVMDIDVEPGWLDIVETLFDRLARLPEERRPHVHQVKEKFGSLRVYLSGYSAETDVLLAEAEALSERTCQECGGPAELREIGGWLATLCDAHFEGPRWTGTSRGQPDPRIVFIACGVATWREGAAAQVEVSLGVSLTDQRTVTRTPAALASYLNAYIPPRPAAAHDPEATAALLDRHVFFPTGIPRRFGIRPAAAILGTLPDLEGETETEMIADALLERHDALRGRG